MNYDLFDLEYQRESWTEAISEDAIVLRQFATKQAQTLIKVISEIATQAPFQYMQTPGGHTMSAAITSCGQLGWISDLQGYRYSTHDPQSKQRWPTMPHIFQDIANQAAMKAGYRDFIPDTCLINRYAPTAKMSLHQDMNEKNYDAPIVSISLGVSATFLFGGLQRSDKIRKIPLTHGDVAVWGGKSRLKFHGILPIKASYHPLTGENRFNITFRLAG